MNFCSCTKCQGFGWYWEPNGSTDQRYECDCGAEDSRYKSHAVAARQLREYWKHRLATLAANLRVGAALCLSFSIAWDGRMNESELGRSVWKPGAGKAAAGWGGE